MEKNIYLYLGIFIVLYGIYRLNSHEKLDNVTVYIKSKYNLEDENNEKEFIELKEKEEKITQIKIRENQIKQFENAKTNITNAQNQEMLIKQKQLEAQLEEIKKEKGYIYNLQDTFKRTLNFGNSSYPTKTYTERFNQIKATINEYMSVITPSVSSLFNKAKTCGFSYKLIGNNATNLLPGQMSMSEDKSKLTLHYADVTNLTGINIPLSGDNIIITDGVSKYQIGINKFNSNVNNTGYFSLDIDISSIPDSFFNNSVTYILFECDRNVSETSIILENQLMNSLYVFIGLVVFSILVINYQVLISGLGSLMGSNQKSIARGGKNIFYVGGYDYRDYSD
jgi:hypothetical protein